MVLKCNKTITTSGCLLVIVKSIIFSFYLLNTYLILETVHEVIRLLLYVVGVTTHTLNMNRKDFINNI